MSLVRDISERKRAEEERRRVGTTGRFGIRHGAGA